MIGLKLQKERILIQVDDIEILDGIRKEYTEPNPVVRFCPHAPLTISPITPLGSIQIGMFKSIYETIENLYPLEEINVDEMIPKKAFPRIKKSDKIINVENTKYQYRDYQLTSIENCLNMGRGVILLPTRSGKSLVMYGILKNANYKKALIVVPNIQLVKQMTKDLIEYGCARSLIQAFSGFSKNIVEQDGIIITNTQYLLKHTENIPESDIIIIDEIHTMKKKSKLTLWLKKQKTNSIFGMTGTLPEGVEDKWNIEGLVGPVLHEEKVHVLQKKKIIADVKIYPIKFIHKNKVKFEIKDYDDIVSMYRNECAAIELVESSNKMIVEIAKTLKGNTLILFDHVEHGRALFDLLDHEDKCFVDGSVKLDNRLETQKKMSHKGNTITIANVKCFGTGLTISELNNIVFAMSGKGATKIIQSIGRSLMNNKEFSILIDIFHNYKYSERHFNKRCELYKEFYDISKLSIKSIDL